MPRRRELVRSRGEFERAAADVEQQDLPRRPPEPAADREEGETGLRFAAEHLQVLTQRRLDASDHLGAVRRLAHGTRCRREEFDDVLCPRRLARLRDGIQRTYAAYLSELSTGKLRQ